MTPEIYKLIPGHHRHMVSNIGNVKTITSIVKCGNRSRTIKGRQLKPTISKFGYKRITLWDGGGRVGKWQYVHRLVLITFKSQPKKDKPFCNHKDGNKLNNDLNNLEWVSTQENGLHAYKLGLSKGKSGESNNQAKLTNKQVARIRFLLKHTEMFQRDIAKKYGVSQPTISLINQGLTWTK